MKRFAAALLLLVLASILSPATAVEASKGSGGSKNGNQGYGSAQFELGQLLDTGQGIAAGVSAQPATTKRTPVVQVVVNAMVRQEEGDRFVEVGSSNDEAAASIERAIKNTNIALTQNKSDPHLDVLIVLGVKSQRIVPASEVLPGIPSLADRLSCIIETQSAVLILSDHSGKLPYVREHRETSSSCEDAAKAVAADVVAWVAANRSRFLEK